MRIASTDPSIHGGRVFGATIGNNRITFNSRAQITDRPYWQVQALGGPTFDWFGDSAFPPMYRAGYQWHWLVIDRQSQALRVYNNGVLIGSKVASDLGRFNLGELYLGAINGQTNAHCATLTQVDRFLVFRNALDQAQIQQEEAGPVPEPATLAALGTMVFGMFRIRRKHRRFFDL